MKIGLYLFKLGSQWFVKEADKNKNGEVSAEEGFNFLVDELEKIYKKVKK